MKTSRQRLLETIRAQRVVTVAELSRSLRMTAANARHHLSILEQQGLVEVVGQRPAKGKGRPAQLYALSNRTQGDNLGALSQALLAELLAGLQEDARQPVLARVAARLAGSGEEIDSLTGSRGVALSQASPRPGFVQASHGLGSRLVAVVQRLNQMGYQARWEAHADAPRLILGRCPYAAILPGHPELCSLDTALLGILAGATAKPIELLAPDERGLPYCLFQIVLPPKR